MKVIIAGGSGLIGIELTKGLIQHGYEVVVLSRNPQRITNLPPGAQAMVWDGKSMQGWGQIVDGADAVINLAGENIAGEHFFPTIWTDKRKRLILHSRLEAGKALVEAIKSAKVKPGVLIQSSAIGFYGLHGDENLDEKSTGSNDFLAKTCAAWEASTLAVQSAETRHVVIRTGVVLSEKGGAFARLLLPFKFFVGGPLGNGRQYLSWIHITDQIGAIRFLLENSSTQGVYNLTAPNPVTNKTFAQIIGKVMRRPSFTPIPAFVFKLMFGEVATVVLDGQRVLPTRLLEAGYTFQFDHAEAAVRNLLKK
jgi:hypothetical protein